MGTEAAEPADRGVVSGVLSSAAQIEPPSALRSSPRSPRVRERHMTGYRIGYGGACVLAVAGLASARLLPARSRAAQRLGSTVVRLDPGRIGSDIGHDHAEPLATAGQPTVSARSSRYGPSGQSTAGGERLAATTRPAAPRTMSLRIVLCRQCRPVLVNRSVETDQRRHPAEHAGAQQDEAEPAGTGRIQG